MYIRRMLLVPPHSPPALQTQESNRKCGLLRAISTHWPIPNLLGAPIRVVLPDVARIPGRDNTFPEFSVDPKDINGCQDCLIDVAEACIERSSYAFIGKRSRELVPIQPDGDVADTITRCTTSHGHGSDHRAIDVTFETEIPQVPKEERLAWRETDWGEFGKTLTALLKEQGFAAKCRLADDPTTIDAAALTLSDCLVQTSEQIVPRSKPSPFTKRWWCAELSEKLRRLKTVLNRAVKPKATPEQRAAVEPARKEYQNALRQQQRQHWAKWLEEATEKTIWQASKYATREPDSVTASRTPDLQQPQGGFATTNEEKSSVLLETFFPDPPPADLDDINNYQYPPALESDTIRQYEVEQALKALSPYKAPGPNAIPNIALQSTSNILAGPLTDLFNACLRSGHQPQHWKEFTTITLRKPQKPDYSIPKAYRPIALEDTVGKVLEAVVAKRLSILAEQFNLLPPNHFGGRPGRTTTDALLYLTSRIKDAWRGKGVVTVLFLDISQAFPSVSHTRLIHNLRRRQVPENLVRWISSFLTERTTSLRFDDFVSELLRASTGIPQGSPMSPILYLFYGADLLEIEAKETRDRFAAGYIDDTTLAAVSPTIEENITKIEDMAKKALEWSRTHACKFDISKFQLVHFTRNERKYNPLPVTVADQTIQPSHTAKYLGIILDRKLRWKEQAERAISVGTKTMLAITRLSKSTFGLPHKYARQLYRTVVQPRMEYGLVVWYEPVRMGTGSRKKGSVGMARRLGKVQSLAGRMITGAFRTTAIDVLDFHASLPPIELHLNQVVFNSAVRLATLPSHHPLHKPVQRAMRYYPLFHRTALHELFHAFPELRSLETIDRTPRFRRGHDAITTRIAPSREEAIAEAKQYEKSSMCIYSDGSGFKGGIGAAAWARGKDGGEVWRLHHLGQGADHTVFEGEVDGTVLGLDIVASTPRITRATILLDNQAAIRAINDQPARPGQYLVNLFHTAFERLQSKRQTLRVHLAWIPGHDISKRSFQ
ncbi:hypothetical protein NLI96_g4374 [Meripilus lineatus]|uniref:Reverse transcriptase domain-containing protein n=1 Tax=Meripilus lineatus TaxID=2056292 RepID=A0AAD5V4R0_9APHY|nr:hypothetical protein NLI96_g4374 [Physisporinus lineatus]